MLSHIFYFLIFHIIFRLIASYVKRIWIEKCGENYFSLALLYSVPKAPKTFWAYFTVEGGGWLVSWEV